MLSVPRETISEKFVNQPIFQLLALVWRMIFPRLDFFKKPWVGVTMATLRLLRLRYSRNTVEHIRPSPMRPAPAKGDTRRWRHPRRSHAAIPSKTLFTANQQCRLPCQVCPQPEESFQLAQFRQARFEHALHADFLHASDVILTAADPMQTGQTMVTALTGHRGDHGSLTAVF